MNCNQFQRTELLFGPQGLARLREASVTIVGCGAVGSFAIEALARSGVGHLTLIDGDTVSLSNINRQLCALHSTIGRFKVDVLKHRIKDICPDTQVDSFPVFLDDNNCADLFKHTPDFVVDAIDLLAGKVALIQYLQQKNIPFISSMGAALKTDFSKIKVAPLNQTSVCPLAARLRKLLKEKKLNLSFPCVFSTEKPVGDRQPGRQMGSLASMTGSFGLILANEVILALVKKHE
ncbi:MAG: tRNA threonylcarbamoyladenosine dehydratase [Alphaproteobacteria bacterium]|nr:tRNA threonylcarbamoyladenosine dehydratase [Alphaproteobacteria bacterium]